MDKATPSSSWDWDRFIQACIADGVPEHSLRWYVLRIERYLQAHAGTRPTEHSAEQVAAYVASAGRHPGLRGWQFRQIVHALQIFFAHVLRLPWASAFDWAYWIASAKELERKHATLARHNHPLRAPTPTVELSASAKVGPEERLVLELRRRNYSIRTEQAYAAWARRYLKFHAGRDPATLGPEDVAAYLNHLALNLEVTPSTQHQALNALVFFHEQILGHQVGAIAGLIPAKKPRKLPAVLTRGEVRRLLDAIPEAPFGLMAGLMYGSGMRLMECIRLRVMDVDFGYSQVVVRDGKGQKDRVVPLPRKYHRALQEQIERALALHREDLAGGSAKSLFPSRSLESIRMHRASRHGSTYSPPESCRPTHAPISSAAIIYTRRRCRRLSAVRPSHLEFASASVAIRCVIRSRRTCSNPDMTSVPSRSCSGMRMSRRR